MARDQGPGTKDNQGFFRGSEFPRMLILLGIAVVGWALFVAFGGPRPEPPKPPAAAKLPPLPPADRAPELQGIQDHEPIRPIDSAGYALLLQRARTMPLAKLQATARRDVLFSQLVTRPARYRGLPIHIEGTALRTLILDDIPAHLTPKERLFEAWVITPDSQNFPWVLVFEDAPPTLPIGDKLDERISFDGYFFKMMSYFGGRTRRYAPVLIGRLRDLGGPGPSGPNYSLFWTLMPLALIFVYFSIRVLLGLRRYLTGAPRPIPRPTPSAEIDPGALQDWIESGALEAEKGPPD